MVTSSPTLTTQPVRPAATHRFVSTVEIVYWVLAVLALAGISWAAHAQLYFGIDLTVTRAVQAFTTPWLTTFMQGVAWPGFPPEVYGMLAVLVVLLFFFHSRLAAFALAAGALVESLLALGLKDLVNRPRPSPDLIHVTDVGFRGASSGWGLGFPAGHPASYFILFGFLLFLTFATTQKNLWRALAMLVFGGLIILVGVSRIYVGDHWFSDVVAGYLLGSIVLIPTMGFYRWAEHRIKKHGD